jgi:hypothetical protein
MYFLPDHLWVSFWRLPEYHLTAFKSHVQTPLSKTFSTTSTFTITSSTPRPSWMITGTGGPIESQETPLSYNGHVFSLSFVRAPLNI